MLSLNEIRRKEQLLSEFNRTHMLSQTDADELKALIQRDSELDDNTKLFLLFALGLIVAGLILGKNR